MPMVLRRVDPLVPLGLLLAVGVGLFANYGVYALVGLGSLLPVFSQVRWVGWRRAFTEPTAATVILLFYLAIIPQRAVVILIDDYQYIDFVPSAVSGGQLAETVLLFAVATALMIEAFHFVTRNSAPPEARQVDGGEPVTPAIALMFLLHGVALLALLGVIRENGGIGGTFDTFGAHDTELFADARSFSLRMWVTFGVPAIWSTGLLAARHVVPRRVRVLSIGLTAIVVIAQLVLFGSRLQAILGLVGCWAIWYFSGRRVPVKVVAGSVFLLIAVSFPILDARSGLDTRIPQHARVSELVGYGILDISMAQRQLPDPVREAWPCPQCWRTLPMFLAPSWPNRPDLKPVKMSTAVVRTFGAPNQQNSGFPATTVTESWIVGGWIGTLLWSVVIGAFAGALHRYLVGGVNPSQATLMWFAVLVTAAFTYYKDGDTYSSIVGIWRSVLYLGIAMAVTGMWGPFRVKSAPGARHEDHSVTGPSSLSTRDQRRAPSSRSRA